MVSHLEVFMHKVACKMTGLVFDGTKNNKRGITWDTPPDRSRQTGYGEDVSPDRGV